MGDALRYMREVQEICVVRAVCASVEGPVEWCYDEVEITATQKSKNP